jgi:hypothetical protein
VVERGADSFSLVAGVSGILWILLLVGPLFGFGLGPSPTSGPGDVAAYYAQHAAVLQRIQVLRACSTLFFLVFLAGLWEVLQRQARSAAPALGVVAAGVSVAGIGLVQYAARQAIALNANRLQDPAVVQTIRDATNALDTFSAFPLAVVVGLTSWVLLGSRGGARWIGRAGLLVTVLLVVGGVGAISEFLRPLGATGFLVSSVWLLVVAALLLTWGVRARRLARVH